MEHTPDSPFALLAVLGDPSLAELCAARLRAEGIEARLRGESLGPYRLTVGEMARTEVWVATADLAAAGEILRQAGLETEPLPEPEPGLQAGQRAGLMGRYGPVVVAAALLALAAWWLLRLVL